MKLQMKTKAQTSDRVALLHEVANDYSLDPMQKGAFSLIVDYVIQGTDHDNNTPQKQLLIYIGGEGGTGKT